MDSARRAEGLLNRSRGKIPNLANKTRPLIFFILQAVGVTAVKWTFFLFREPRFGKYNHVQTVKSNEAMANLLEVPAHSPALILPVVYFYGLWIAQGILHLTTMACETLTVCYCIDVEMAGGTETDALYVSRGLREVYMDMGGGESERELANAMAQGAVGF